MRSLNDDKKKTVKSTPVKIKSTPVKNNNNNISTPKKGATLQMNNNSKTITLPKAQHANSGPGSALGVLPDELSGGIQDTIYLCNFRVSVDGEWLCLKELQDLDIQDNSGKNQSTSGNMLSGRTGTDIVSTSGSGNNGSSGSYINNFGILSNDYENNLSWPKYCRLLLLSSLLFKVWNICFVCSFSDIVWQFA